MESHAALIDNKNRINDMIRSPGKKKAIKWIYAALA